MTMFKVKVLCICTWFARAIPLKTAASILEPSSQSPHIPALPKGSKMQGTPGVLVGRAAPLQISELHNFQ